MKRFWILLMTLTSAWLTATTPARATEPALLDYVQAEDDTYRYTVRQQFRINDVQVIELTLTSQTWRGIPWKHRLFILKPSTMTNPKQGFLLVTGGNWHDEDVEPLPQGQTDIPNEAPFFAGLATRMSSPIIVLLNVPQQPIFDGRREDAIIAYTFDQFLNTQESNWPLLLPMVKSAVRAMDASTEVVQDLWSIELEHFTVTGFSKRGWTTWLTGAIDPRVNAIVPGVIDMLNMGPQIRHQIEAWGKPSEQIRDYTELGITDRFDEPAGIRLRNIVDPYAYREQLTMPKLILLGTNDPYWPVDALNLYWDDLVGDKRILYIPNAGHGLESGVPQVLATLTAAHLAAGGLLEMPNLQWSFEETADALLLHVQADQKPRFVQAWSAHTPTRDFRASQWHATTITPTKDGYTYRMPRPETGHAAMFAELIFQANDLTYNLSTQLQVIEATPTTAAQR